MQTGRAWGWMLMLLLALVGAPPLVKAGEIHQCIGRGGHVSWNDGACPAGSRQAAALAFSANDGEETRWRNQRMQDIRDWQRRNRAEVAASVAGARRGRGGFARVQADGAGRRCEQARQRRDRSRDREFMRMTYERALALDDAVRDACR